MTLQALLFDVDGTLADTEEVHRQAFNVAFRQHGLDWDWDPVLYKRLLRTTGGKERMRRYCEEFQPAVLARADADGFIASLHKDKTRYYNERVASGLIPLRPGVDRLLQEALAAGLRLAIATTTTPENVLSLLESTLGADGVRRFEVIGASDCVPAKKPAPDIYRWVMNELDLPPTVCMAFEDTANGLMAGLAASLPTVVTVSRYSEGEEFNGATAVLSDLGEPEAPFRLLQGEAYGRSYVDVALLHLWHHNGR